MPSLDADRIETVLCDLDGVVWLAHDPIAGSVDAIDRLRRSGRRVLFVTNNSAALVSEHESLLAAIGVDATGDVISSAIAAASLVATDERVLVTGGPGIAEAVESVGAIAVRNTGRDLDADVDAVVVGLDRDFDYDRMRVAGRAVLDGARLVGTNRDSTYPTPRGLEPGGGAIVAAIASVGDVEPEFAGKPEQPMADLVLDLVGGDPQSMLMVGDRPETDGLFAERIGCRFALVESGVTRAGRGTHLDLAAVVDSLD